MLLLVNILHTHDNTRLYVYNSSNQDVITLNKLSSSLSTNIEKYRFQVQPYPEQGWWQFPVFTQLGKFKHLIRRQAGVQHSKPKLQFGITFKWLSGLHSDHAGFQQQQEALPLLYTGLKIQVYSSIFRFAKYRQVFQTISVNCFQFPRLLIMSTVLNHRVNGMFHFLSASP